MSKRFFPEEIEDPDSLVRSRRLELPRVAPQRPQRCASTNSATTARGEARGLANVRGFVKSAAQNASMGSGQIVVDVGFPRHRDGDPVLVDLDLAAGDR